MSGLLETGSQALEAGDWAAARAAFEAIVAHDDSAVARRDRLARLVEDFELEPLRGWALVTRAVLEPHEPVAAAASTTAACCSEDLAEALR